ncbi:MAG: metallophosphoesterase [Solobacterium sp.]|nr:metallophosphoesterase [Solobacterium sp.]
MKRLLVIFAALVLAACTAEKPAEKLPVSFHAAVVSDLHYTRRDTVSDAIVPLITMADEVMTALVRQVIAIHPDVLIITGDNTNDGDDSDEKRLAAHLKQVKEAGIDVVMTTGNHDFNFTDAKTYQDNFSEILVMTEKDDDSLSYVRCIGGMVIFAMDDSLNSPVSAGYYSDQTIAWLKRMLEKYSDRTVLFACHHPVLMDYTASESSEKVLQLLKKHDVPLIFSGHVHSQTISTDDGIYEITSAMPLSSPRLIGELTVENGVFDYHTVELDLEAYMEREDWLKAKRLEEAGQKRSEETYLAMLKERGCRDPEACLELFYMFLRSYSEGSLADHVNEIVTNPYYGDMMDALYQTNYGPWMAGLLAHPPLTASYLHIEKGDQNYER